eukprot:gb/GFBE01036700.1/.p1 GENE.gb/GFBE01036700.1/~~gb/GFBE01036700.1/.p1  ORF type:complete len:106 (+),score=10.41 gb/GFBE01036700.1/:1-318(+)
MIMSATDCSHALLFKLLATQSAVSTVLMFDFPLGPFGLLLGDMLVYGGATTANGIGEGWAMRAAVDDSEAASGKSQWTYQTYKTLNTVLCPSLWCAFFLHRQPAR